MEDPQLPVTNSKWRYFYSERRRSRLRRPRCVQVSSPFVTTCSFSSFYLEAGATRRPNSFTGWRLRIVIHIFDIPARIGFGKKRKNETCLVPNLALKREIGEDEKREQCRVKLRPD